MRESQAETTSSRYAAFLKRDRLDCVTVPGLPDGHDKPGLGKPAFFHDKHIDSGHNHTGDFGLEWTELFGNYRYDRGKHYEQFLRMGIVPENLRGAAVLDGGMGLGRLTELALGEAKVVVGCDLSESVHTAATYIHAENFVPVKASIADLPLNDAVFDFAFSWGVVHHCPDWRAALDELWRVVKPGGMLVAWVYDNSPNYRRRSFLNWHLKDFSEHEMLPVADGLTNVAHTLQLTAGSTLNLFLQDACFTVKNTKEYTRLILYDGIGPDYHHLIDKGMFLDWGKSKGVMPEFRESPALTAVFRKPAG